MTQKETKKVSKPIFLIGCALLLGGCIAVWFYSINPILKTLDARDWPEVPCKIISVELETYKDSDGTSYNFDIKYQYTYDDKTYSSDKYSFMPQVKGHKKPKKAIVDKYKQDKEHVCYVNPKKPEQAVLKRGFHKGLLFAFVPFIFVCVGLLVIVSQLEPPTPLPMTRKTREDWLPIIKVSATSRQQHSSTPITLQGSRIVGVLVAVLVVNVVYNIIVSTVYFNLYQWIVWGAFFENAWVSLIVPAFGVLLACMAMYLILALFNPRPIIQISAQRFPLDSSGQVRWSFRGRTSSIQHLNITLQANEWISYSTGSDSSTTKESIFYRMELIDSDDPYNIRNGQARILIPQDTMHSFEAKDNKIVWQIVVRGVVRFWPDIKNEFKIAVVPIEMAEDK
ncbi:MAG: DUF3592 domain-containing protein [Planctomycetota bacterium]|jgi:hypothetical protein